MEAAQKKLKRRDFRKRNPDAKTHPFPEELLHTTWKTIKSAGDTRKFQHIATMLDSLLSARGVIPRIFDEKLAYEKQMFEKYHSISFLIEKC